MSVRIPRTRGESVWFFVALALDAYYSAASRDAASASRHINGQPQQVCDLFIAEALLCHYGARVVWSSQGVSAMMVSPS